MRLGRVRARAFHPVGRHGTRQRARRRGVSTERGVARRRGTPRGRTPRCAPPRVHGVTTSAQKSRSASAPASTFPPSATTATAATTSAGANAESARLKAAWQLYYTHENAYLNWVRNGITATAVGTAFAMFRLGRDQAEFSLGGVVMQTIGLTYVLLGAAQYLGTAFLLRHELCISGLGCLWYVFNAAWPTTLFVVGMRCIHDHHPPLFISALAANVELLPAHLQSRWEIVSEMRRREFDRERERRNEPRA